jgi:tRNA(Ile)-lysidine synthase
MVLLAVLHALSQTRRWRLTIAHLNHKLRGRRSDADELLVRRTGQRLGLPVIFEHAEVRQFAQVHKVSIEMAARAMRHEFLARTARAQGISRIALAHHADDQIEPFFLRLLRGSGSEGLAGMAWSNPSPANRRLTLVRPLLDLSRQELRDYAMANHIAFREDASNAALDFQRNRVRQELLPLLRKHYQPALEKIALRQIKILSAETEFISDCARVWLVAAKRARRHRKPGNSFTRLPLALQRRCIHMQLIDSVVRPEFHLVEHLRLKPGQRVSVSPTITAVRDEAGIVHIEKTRQVAFTGESHTLDLGEAGRAQWDGLKLAWQIKPVRGKVQFAENCEYFDADRVGTSVTLRHWQPGDRFQPIGMESALKLQDFFTNQRIPRQLRHELTVAAAAQGEIFWVEGQRISERFKLTNHTIRRLHWAWERL